MNKKFSHSILLMAAGATLLAWIAVVPAQAQTTATVAASATVSAKGSARLPDVISKGDAAIADRLTKLNALNTRVSAMKNVSATEKSTLAATIQTNISGLTTLKAKLDADTDVTTAATDAKSIRTSFRIYALIIPQGYIAAAADRADTIVGLLTTVSTKLQTRISAEPAGTNVTAMQASLTDLNAKIATAQTTAASAENSVATLTPDQGNATLLASNTASLKAARAQITTVTTDLKAADADAKSIVAALK
jgi:hypothetical protein